jgi:uncharacterized protein involved in response to NO
VMVFPVWKVLRPSTRGGLFTGTLRAAGLSIVAGLALAALAPAAPIAVAGHHVAYVGGFGLLTMAIATRVIVVHGAHGVADEPRVLTWFGVAPVALAVVARVGAEFAGPGRTWWLAAAGLLWTLGWCAWGAGALPRIARLAKRPPLITA